MRVAVRFLAMGAVLMGVVLVLHSAALLLWQYIGLIDSRAWPALPARLWFIDHSLLGNSAVGRVLPFIPEFQWPWLSSHPVGTWILDRMHIGVLPAALGALLAAAGRSVLRHQTEALRLAKQHRQDRLRRAREYRKQPLPEERKEPTLRTEPRLRKEPMLNR